MKLNFDENGIIFWDKEGSFSIPDSVETPIRLERFEVISDEIVESDKFRGMSNDEIDDFIMNDVPFDLEDQKNILIERINVKADSVYTLLERKYRVSERLGTITDLKREKAWIIENMSKYEALGSEEDKSQFLITYCPAIYTYMYNKNRTLEEQLFKIGEKQQLTHLTSVKTEALIKQVDLCESEEQFKSVESMFKILEDMETVEEFMAAMAS